MNIKHDFTYKKFIFVLQNLNLYFETNRPQKAVNDTTYRFEH